MRVKILFLNQSVKSKDCIYRECPYDLKEAISSIIFAAPRCADLPELQQVSDQFFLQLCLFVMLQELSRDSQRLAVCVYAGLLLQVLNGASAV